MFKLLKFSKGGGSTLPLRRTSWTISHLSHTLQHWFCSKYILKMDKSMNVWKCITIWIGQKNCCYHENDISELYDISPARRVEYICPIFHQSQIRFYIYISIIYLYITRNNHHPFELKQLVAQTLFRISNKPVKKISVFCTQSFPSKFKIHMNLLAKAMNPVEIKSVIMLTLRKWPHCTHIINNNVIIILWKFDYAL